MPGPCHNTGTGQRLCHQLLRPGARNLVETVQDVAGWIVSCAQAALAGRRRAWAEPSNLKGALWPLLRVLSPASVSIGLFVSSAGLAVEQVIA